MGRRSNRRRRILRNRKKQLRRGNNSTADGRNNKNMNKSQDNNNNNTSCSNNKMQDNNNNNNANNGINNNDEKNRDRNNNNTSASNSTDHNNMKKIQDNNNNNTSYSNNKSQDSNNNYYNNTNSNNHNNNNNNANNFNNNNNNNNHNTGNPNHNTSLNDSKKKKKKNKKKLVNARTSDVLKEKMLRTHKPHRTPYAMRPRDRKCMTCQKDEKALGRKLRRCGKCGMAAYCDIACQKAHRVVHKAYCEFWSNQNTPDRANGERCILFDQTFGGYYSLYQGHSYRQHGIGILVATLSHPAADFVAIKDTDRKDKRTITFSYVRKSKIRVFLSKLSMERKNANGVNNEENECFAATVREGLKFVRRLSQNIGKGMFFVLVLKSPERQPVEVHIMQVLLSDQSSMLLLLL